MPVEIETEKEATAPEEQKEETLVSESEEEKTTEKTTEEESLKESEETVKESITEEEAIETTIESEETTTAEILSLAVPRKDEESGYLVRDEEIYKPYANIFYIGDTNKNNPSRSFISFDISDLSGITVISAEFSATPYKTWGDASGLFPIGIFVADWGPVSIYTCEFYQDGILVGESMSQNILCSTEALKDELQSKIDSGLPRFQIMIYFTGAETNGNNEWDGYSYGVPYANLNISYTR